MKAIINFFKSFIGLIIFYVVQIGFSIIFYNLLVKGNQSFNSFIYIAMELTMLIILFFIYKDELISNFKDFDNNYAKYLKIGIKAYLIGLLGMMVSNFIINMFILNGGIAYNEQVDRIILFKYPLYATIAIIITGPIIEEIVFRLGFKKYINNKKLYYILASLIFAFVHVKSAISTPSELLYLIPYGSLSIAFTYTLDKTDNIFSTIILHAMHNTITVLLILSISLLGA